MPKTFRSDLAKVKPVTDKPSRLPPRHLISVKDRILDKHYPLNPAKEEDAVAKTIPPAEGQKPKSTDSSASILAKRMPPYPRERRSGGADARGQSPVQTKKSPKPRIATDPKPSSSLSPNTVSSSTRKTGTKVRVRRDNLRLPNQPLPNIFPDDEPVRTPRAPRSHQIDKLCAKGTANSASQRETADFEAENRPSKRRRYN
ncbi:hypothetical protein NM688_g9327 [Phlebia brevispora]|uniref:Uncharacterized protein n=1 Tax=Phlebia brevispora TaxID=194682 RepID=A0ACC1RIE4_9APHY|nr:hypothetical protein NM688_g9327 [Phlebia brevispora]